MRIAAILVAGLAGLAGLAGCSRAPQSLSLFDEVRQGHFQTGRPGSPGLTFARAPEAVTLTAAHERRPAVLTAVDTWTWHGRIPERAELFGGVQILPEGWAVIRGFEAKVTLRAGRTSEVLAVARSDRQDPQRWVDFSTDLADWAGREVTLEFAARLDGLPAKHRHSNVVAWSPVRLAAAGAQVRRPNILFIVVDTLRADHTTPYGYKRETTPNLERLLAGPGVVAENAYSQAPWTLPSVTSFLTGCYPGELLGDNFAAYGIPADVKSLAQRMSALGYQTGGFYANRTLHSGNGFDRGFDTFYSPAATEPDAAELNARALPWLGAHRRDPFFLYVHYIDPHDPYVNPEVVDNRTPFYPEYRGKVAGNWIHGIYNGRLKLEDPERDVAQVVALYDTEIHYADRFVGELIEAIPPDVLEDTLIVFTADHGEELHDHGGWKHGYTLYDEQIHVPLFLRWDGHLPAGRRLPGTVRLLDLVPTLLDAVGEKPDPALPGVSLLPALAGKAALPRLPAFAQHMMTGPLRAAVVLDRKKLILFNGRTPFAPADDLQKYLWTLDLARLKRVELYDLAKDPGERANRAAGAADRRTPEDLRRLEPLIHRQLDRERPG
ncbi:MAG TPA: sulfatase, partial [Thermoanaerobaculia bacterium]|nr:sulfatase [Thermoanaerobaculia bacterium]